MSSTVVHTVAVHWRWPCRASTVKARRARAGLIMMAGVILTASSPSVAGTINCKQVRKYLGLPGRDVQYVAMTMGISEDEVKKCQNGADTLTRDTTPQLEAADGKVK